MESIKATLVGVAPLLMCNGQMADPLNEHARALAEAIKDRKNKKTIEGIALIRRLEWLGHIYQDTKGIVGIPGDSIVALVLGGAKKSKRGQEAKAGVYEAQPFFPLVYDGPKKVAELYKDPRFVDCRGVRQQRNRIMRTRPIFKDWKLPIELHVETDIMDRKAVETALVEAGVIGLGDYHYRFGRFTVEFKKS
jgi:hypothetical protein